MRTCLCGRRCDSRCRGGRSEILLECRAEGVPVGFRLNEEMVRVSMRNHAVIGSATHCGVLGCAQLRQILCIVEPDLVTRNLGVDCSTRVIKIKEAER